MKFSVDWEASLKQTPLAWGIFKPQGETFFFCYSTYCLHPDQDTKRGPRGTMVWLSVPKAQVLKAWSPTLGLTGR